VTDPQPVESRIALRLLAVGKWVDAHAGWLVPILTAAATLMLTAVGASGWWFIPGGFALLAVASIEIVRYNWRRSFKRDVEAATNMRVVDLAARHSLLADTFAEIASAAADMASMAKPNRIAASKDLVKQVVNAIAWIVHEDVPGLRAVVYEVNDDDAGLSVVRWSSRGHRAAPNPFEPGTDRAIKALALLNRGGSLFVDDIANAPADEWAGSGVGYNTFISSVIESPTGAYGLLTVDAPLTDDLTEDDENDLRLIAGILAMIFAEYRR
jgi:hypothetical protein